MTEREQKQLTNERTRAVRQALNKERGMVEAGSGTRDWTPEQQKEILAGEQPHDKNGIAFEGHHMKSVNEHEQQAGNPNNIQWLSREEHFAAHGGSFHHPTNGCYHPENGNTEQFRRYPKAPEARQLSSSVKNGENQSLNATESKTKNASSSHGR